MRRGVMFAMLACAAAVVPAACVGVLSPVEVFYLADGSGGATDALLGEGDARAGDALADGAAPCDPGRISDDPQNCGACGRACEPGSACTTGQCAPRVLASLSLKMDQHARWIAVDGAGVYVVLDSAKTGTERPGVVQVELDGGGIVQTYRRPNGAVPYIPPGQIAVDPSYVAFVQAEPYDASASGVLRCPRDGGACVQRMSGFVKDIEAVGSSFFYATLDTVGGAPFASQLMGPPLYDAATPPELEALAADDAGWCVTAPSGSFGRVYCDSRLVTANATGDMGSVAVSGNHVFWASHGLVSGVRGTSRDGGPDIGFGTPMDVYDIAADATHVYWTDRGSKTVWGCPVTGCGQPTPVATAQEALWGVAADAAFVYFVREAGTATRIAEVVRVPKLR